MAITDDIVEYEANEDPNHEVDRCCRWHHTHCEENQREVEMAQESDLELLLQCPLDSRKDCTKQEEE